MYKRKGRVRVNGRWIHETTKEKRLGGQGSAPDGVLDKLCGASMGDRGRFCGINVIQVLMNALPIVLAKDRIKGRGLKGSLKDLFLPLKGGLDSPTRKRKEVRGERETRYNKKRAS